MPITRSDVGAWLVKGNPKRFRYDESRTARVIGRGDAIASKWGVGATYRNSLVREGDPFVLYLGGSTAAVVEVGIVSGPLFQSEWDEDFTTDEADRRQSATCVPYTGVVLSDPIPRAVFKRDTRFANAEVVRTSQFANPSFLTHAELRALAGYLSPGDLRIAAWGDRMGATSNAR